MPSNLRYLDMELIFEDEKLKVLNRTHYADVHNVDYGMDVIRGFQKAADILTCIESVKDLNKIVSLDCQLSGCQFSVRASAGYRICFMVSQGMCTARGLQRARPPVHPGTVIYDELEYLDIPQSTFSELTGISRSLVNQVLKGKRAVTTEFALLTQEITGISARLLLEMQMRYNIWRIECLSKFKKKKERISDKDYSSRQVTSEADIDKSAHPAVITVLKLSKDYFP